MDGRRDGVSEQKKLSPQLEINDEALYCENCQSVEKSTLVPILDTLDGTHSSDSSGERAVRKTGTPELI